MNVLREKWTSVEKLKMCKLNSGLLTVLYNKIIKLERELNLNSELFCDVIAVEPFECTYMSMYVNDYKIIPNECANDASKRQQEPGNGFIRRCD